MMALGRRFTQARSLDEYGNAGYVLSVLILVPFAALLEWTVSGVPLLGTLAPTFRESLRTAIISIAPALAPLIDLPVSSSGLVLVLLTAASFRKGFRTAFGIAFATAVFDVAGLALGAADVLVRRRIVVTAFATALAILLPAGFAWEKNKARERAAVEVQFAAFARRVQRFVSRTTLSAHESDRAQRVLETWNDQFRATGLATKGAVAVVDLLAGFYGEQSTEDWDARVAGILANATVSDDAGADEWVAASRILLGQATIHTAVSQNCASGRHIDRAARLFSGAKAALPEASAYGLSLSYRCAFDHHLLAAGAKDVELCANALECARGALDFLVEGVPRGGTPASACDDVELRRRAGRLDLLIRLASNYSKLPSPVWLSEARSAAQLAAQIDRANLSILQCSELARLPDATAFMSVAEGYAARFSLLAVSAENAEGALELALSSARWLITAMRVAPPDAWQWWEFSRFCPIVRKTGKVAAAFLEIVGKEGAVLCP
jgi:hypothetical protein